MSAARTHPPFRRKTGAQLDAKGTEYLRMRCTAMLARGPCGVMQEEPRAEDMTVRKQLAETDCLFCGSAGQMIEERKSA